MGDKVNIIGWLLYIQLAKQLEKENYQDERVQIKLGFV